TASPIGPTEEAPWTALVASVREHLDDDPCYVTFSGGCDSSLVLAAATDACRNTGHSDPVPITYRYPGESADEPFQRPMLDWLGLEDWIHLDLTDSALLAPETTLELQRTGVVWPPSLHTRAAALRTVGPGLLLSGDGGDEVLGSRRVTAAA